MAGAGLPTRTDFGTLIDTGEMNISANVATLLGAATFAAFRSSLGLDTGDSPQFTGVNLGHASDTTLTRSAAGKAALEGKAIPLMSGAFDAVFAGPSAARTYTFPDADMTVFGNSGNLTFAEAQNLVFGTTTGTKFGTGTTQKIGFYNATPIIQPTGLTDAATNYAGVDTVDKSLVDALGTKVNAILTRLEALGLFATA